MAREVLKASAVVKSYDGVHALRGADFSLAGGEVHALMGENGAGKSTLAKIMAGVVRQDSGEIAVDGETIKLNSPLVAQTLGISIIHQELDLFPNLSVAENIATGNREFVESGITRPGEMRAFSAKFLKQAGLTVAPQRSVASLSIGEMQLVMIARALSMQARIIIMDEPTSSLFHDSVERLFRLIDDLRAQGVSIVYVSHKMDEIFRICDRITVMRDGKTIGTRAKGEVSGNELIGMMVGRPWEAGKRRVKSQGRGTLLAVEGLFTRKLKDIAFELGEGEVLGVAGLVGAGRSELCQALMGLERWKQGTMMLRGKTAAPDSVQVAFQYGMRLLAEDRKLDGLMMQMSVLENGTLADLPSLARGGITSHQREEQAIAPLFGKLALKTSSFSAPVSSLSGGNQQKVLLARCLLADPSVLLLDDPTRGIDVGAKEDVYKVIEKLAAQGKGILFVSSELPELLRCCDRILVMREGRITASLDAEHTTQEEIMAFATNPIESPGEAFWRN